MFWTNYFGKKYSLAGELRVCFLEGEGVKYYSYTMDGTDTKTLTTKITIYNTDHSIFKNISKTLTLSGKKVFDNWNQSVSNVSSKLFNTTNDIEYSLSYGIRDTITTQPCPTCPAQQSTVNNSFLRVFSDNGGVVFECDTCSINSIGANNILSSYDCGAISNINGSYKFSIISYKISDGYEPRNYYYRSVITFIYSLPGTFTAPLVLDETKQLNQDKASLSAPMPNPSSETTRIEFQLPAESSLGEIMVYNTMGIRVKSYKVDNAFGDLLLNNSDLSSGNYTYQLIAGGKRIGSQKMMIIK